MLLSIIIPSFNRSIFLPALLQSILSQGLRSIEVIVINDGSTDDTDNIMREFQSTDCIRYFTTRNSERGAARNFGLRQSTGQYINFFDSDDLFLPCLEKLNSFIETTQPDVVYGDIMHVDENGEILESAKLPYKEFTANLIHNNFLACGSVFLKREVALQFPFNEDRRLSSAEDWELWLRLHTRYYFTHFPGFIFKQQHHPNRSLLTIDPNNVEKRDEYFSHLIRANTELQRFYGSSLVDLFIADRCTFIALSWCENNNRLKALYYWIKAVTTSVLVISRKRFWAVLKKICFP